MATFTFHFSFISIIVFKTSGVFREKGKETGLNACCQMANIQPTRSRGEGTEEVKTIMSYRSLLDIKPYSSLKPRFGLQGKNLPGHHGPVCFAVPACVCVQSPRHYAYRQSSLGILTPVAHSLRGGSVVIQGLQFLSCFCKMSTAPNQAKCTLLLLHGPGNYQIQMLLTGACPVQLAVGSYPLSFPVYRNW